MIKAIQKKIESNYCPIDRGKVYVLVSLNLGMKNELE